MGDSGLGEGARRMRAQDPGDVAMHIYQPRGIVWSLGALVPYMFDRPTRQLARRCA